MCGIFGVWKDNTAVDLVRLVAALRSIRHRGPDDEGFWLSDISSGRDIACAGMDSDPRLSLPRIETFFGQRFDLAFGFRRLSILDLSPAGHQPMSNAEGSLWIIFNGEIYNYIELRDELKTLGYAFCTQTDTEVILNAYDAWGTDCLQRFNGMWAFALFDKRKRLLFCARDRFGIKPFYYHAAGGGMIFGSEIKALFAYADLARKPNRPIVYDYLAYGLLDHTENTFYEGIKQLPAAHFLTLHNGALAIRRYWDLEDKNKLDLGDDAQADREYARRFYEIFEDSIRLHLRSDVPVGSCLSGGLDSSSIVCVANKLLFGGLSSISPGLVGLRQKTFSSCFEDERFDERPHIQKVLALTSAEANYTFPSPEMLREELPALLWHQDEPFASTSVYAQWRVMKLAAERGIRVLLDGQGADEMLAGYHPYFNAFWAGLIRRGRAAELLKEWLAYHKIFGAPFPLLIRRAFSSLAPFFLQTKFAWLKASAFGINPQFAREFKGRYFDFETGKYTDDVLSSRLYVSVMQTSLPGLLRYEDRNSMAHSIEARVPFLDYRLVEYVFSLPNRQKIRSAFTKWALRESMQGVLPEEVRLRTDKKGFVTPEQIWLSVKLRGWLDDIVHSPSFCGREFFNASKVARMLKDYASGKRDFGFAAWRLVNLELWLSGAVDSAPPARS